MKKIVVSTQQDANSIPSITGSNYGKVFSLAQFHLHWGYNAYQGSEHLINYQKYPLEVKLLLNFFLKRLKFLIIKSEASSSS